MQLICVKKVLGVDQLINLTTAPGLNFGSFVKSTPGVGKQYLVFNSLNVPIPGWKIAAADFTAANAPTAKIDVAANNADVQAMIANPPSQTCLTWYNPQDASQTTPGIDQPATPAQ